MLMALRLISHGETMNEYLGLLFSDGSILVLPDGTDLQTAAREAAEHDAGDLSAKTKVVRLSIEIVEYL
jgi:hypothetical protein